MTLYAHPITCPYLCIAAYSIYRGEWEANARSGCGVELTRNEDGSFLAKEGQFMNDTFIGPVMACPASIAVSRAAEADAAAQKARAFVLKD